MKRFGPKIGDLVHFTWQDHCSLYGAGWKREDSDDWPDNKPALCQTVGFVVKIDKQCITTASSWDGIDAYSQFSIRLRRDIVKGRVMSDQVKTRR